MAESIKKNSEFQLVYKNGKSYGNKLLVMYALKNDLNRNRLGISAGKKVGNSVVRHRIARLLRESFRLNDEKFHSGWDMVVVARPLARGKSFWEIESAFMHLAKLHGIINNETAIY
ncbi:MAG: ribonuclease P protein component [Butyrivibrio sp.]|nr:ribonuclease P protein component [Butyrivibrio sp.]